jgi:N-acyl-phosphatidylethanolamine-hydrolysing phospholipase D
MPVPPLPRGLCLLLAALALSAPAEEAPRPHHHRDGGFQNNYLEFQPKTTWELLKWQWQSARDGLPKPPDVPTPRVVPEHAFIRANATAASAMEPAVTWVGHATMLVQMGGQNLLTDPMFSERASPVGFAGPKRHVPPGLSLEELPHIDVVVISHNHYDHLDAASVKALHHQPGGPPLFLVPLGLKAWMADEDITNVVELDWWQSHRVGLLEVVLTPVQHWSARGVGDRMRTLWGGYAVFAPDFQLFFAGDTGYSPDFADIRARFADRQGPAGFDLAVLPVGAYEPRWFMQSQHVNPEESVRIHRDLLARRSVGMHWGTFELTDESLDQPPRDLATARKAQGVPDDDFFLLAIGETRRLPRRGDTAPPGPQP